MPKKMMRKRSKRYGKKKTQFGGRKIGLRQPVHYFKRTLYTPTSLISSSTADVPFSFRFRLVDLPPAAVTDFTGLYDQYKIRAVKVSIIPRSNDYGSGITAARIFSVLDYDDSIIPGSLNEILQYQNVKMTTYGKVHSRYFKPSVNFQGGILGTTNNMALPKKNVWIDIASTDVPHFGMKGVITPTSGALAFDLKVEYYLAMKNVR